MLNWISSLKVCWCLVLLLPQLCWAWGDKGHKVVAHIAWQNLTPQSQQWVTQLLKDGGFGTFEDAANWPDDIRDNKDYKHTGNWHYVNLPRQQTQILSLPDCPRGCVISALQANLKQLQQTQNKRLQAESLAFVIHLVADMHQPLHVSYADDKGGNTYLLKLKSKTINLHYYWDTAVLAERQNAFALSRQIPKHFSQAQQQAWRYDDEIQWLSESFAITQSIYGSSPKHIDAAQLQADRAVAHQRLLQAGIRAAELINKHVK